MNCFPQGSEWRKWDLHVHTPASVLNNGFGQNWDDYVTNLFRTLLAKEIAAVGITDYFTIEGYKKLKEDYLNKPAKMAELFTPEEVEAISKILVVPNVEFRSEVFVGPGNGNSVNFHVIMSDELSPRDIEEKFLHEIDFVYQGRPQDEDSKRKLKEANLEELGERLLAEHQGFTGTPLQVGMMNAVIDHKQVSKILSDKQATFGGKYLFVSVADEDLSRIGWNSRDHHTRKVLVQKSDLLFASNPKTASWALGKPPYGDGAAKFLTEFASLKPCIHGSDAHEQAFIGHPCALRGKADHSCQDEPDKCQLRNCWIKADATFEGLKQILCEPEDRVMIADESPKPNKSYQTIGRIDIEKAQLGDELGFAGVSIELNEGLVAVTGGKGGGKTALVDLLANSYLDRAGSRDKNSFVRRIGASGSVTSLKTQVTLTGGQEHSKEANDGSFFEGVSVVYLAQGELEEHVEDPTKLEAHINQLIFESDGVKDTQLRFDYESVEEEIAEIRTALRAENTSILKLEDEGSAEKEAQLTAEGKVVEVELNDVKKKEGELAKLLSPERLKEAEEKQKQLGILRDRKELLSSLAQSVREAIAFVDTALPAFNQTLELIKETAVSLGYSEKLGPATFEDSQKLRDVGERVRLDLRTVVGQIEKFQKELEEKDNGIKDHAKLLDRRRELEKLLLRIAERLEVLRKSREQCAARKQARTVLFRKLLGKRKEQREKYLAIISAFSADKNVILSDLEFIATLSFDNGRFADALEEVTDARKLRVRGRTGADSDIKFFSDAIADFAADPTDDKIEALVGTHGPALYQRVLDSRRKAETLSLATIYDAIFDDYLSIAPSVKYKKVPLSKLSLGQKATVLIKIYLAQGENPIIIDSHDDHLDNEFIMDELVSALRQAKNHRQVIVVSNNGNVVINSDAEQVVIAARDESGTISYDSGSIENPSLRGRLLNVLEGGETAFDRRKNKYRLKS